MDYCYLFEEEILFHIVDHIEKKYNPKRPIFIVNGKKLSASEINEWTEIKEYVEGKWIKYRHVRDEIFELKDFFPDPPQKICDKTIDDLYEFLEKKAQSKEFLIKIGFLTYSPSQARNKLMHYLREGSTMLYTLNESPVTIDKKLAFEVHTSQHGEVYWDIHYGFRILEFKQ